MTLATPPRARTGTTGRGLAEPRPAPRLGARVVSGVRWNLLDQVVQQGLRIAISVALARLLLPREFGVAALAFIVSDLAKVFGDVGVASGLVYVRSLRPLHVRTSVTSGFGVGLAMTLLVLAAAPSVATFFHQPAVRPVLMALSTVFVMKGLVAPVQSLWRRDLDFRPFVVSNAIAVGVAGPAAVAAAAGGAGVWALVFYALAEAFVGLVVSYALAIRQRRHPFTPGFELRAFRELFAFGALVSGTRMVLYGRQNVDNLIVGRVLGASQLGYYDFAYNLMLYPIQRLSSVVSAVSFPAFSRLRQERTRLAIAYTRSLRAICAVAFPVTVGSAAAAPLYVPVIFGDRWRPAVPVVEVLALNGVRLSMTTLNGTVMEATGRPGWNLMLNSVMLGMAIPGFLIGVHFGILGVAIAYTIVGCSALPASATLAGRRLGMSLLAQAREVRAPAIASVAMAAAMEGARHGIGARMSRPVALLPVLALGAAVYLGCLARLDRVLLHDAMSSLVARRQSHEVIGMPTPETQTGHYAPEPIVAMAHASPSQWDLLAAAQRRLSTADRVMSLLQLADTRWDGFAVSQLTHCLQAATRAERAGADEEMIVAALCHDIGKAIPHSDHGAVAATILKPHVRRDVADVIRTHAAFQRRYTHAYLGGSADDRKRYRHRRWFALAEQFSEWDQASFDPSYDTMPLSHFEDRLRRVLESTSTPRRRTGLRLAAHRARSALVAAVGLG